MTLRSNAVIPLFSTTLYSLANDFLALCSLSFIRSYIHSDIHETPAGVKQVVSNGENGRITQEIVDRANKYVEEEVLVQESYAKVRKDCKNRNPQCAYWAAIGECEENVRSKCTSTVPRSRVAHASCLLTVHAIVFARFLLS